ncbi:LamG-like jellyroll fold domain-containing protein [Streptomyces erythrochromogenes]|uniref:LamG-like jellyroll fold domain-containing protein n=1 Tax=Streptomyces erythrochromogenes TaxID=285574 RepID=UPI00369DCC20
MTTSLDRPAGSLGRMTGDLTVPFGRGADTLALTLLPSAAAGAGPGDTLVADYGFAEHRARFDAGPEPAYAATAVTDVVRATTLTVGYEVPLPDGTVRSGTATVTVQAGTVAGSSFGIALPPADAAVAVLRTLRADPPPAAAHAAGAWRLTALLGNLARLLWIVGAERDVLDRHTDDVRALAQIGERVAGPTLDLIGYDLGVPRFPPQPYGQQDGTLALYHLEDAPGSPVHDSWPLYLGGGTGHSGTATGDVQAGAPGRFGAGMRFAVPGAEITVPHHADLSTDATTSLTAECFVKPDSATGEGAVLSKHTDPDDAALPGWALSIGTFGRGITRNVRMRVADGTAVRDLFADRSLPTTRFTHLAAVIDRSAGRARLFLDGEAAAIAPLTAADGLPPVTGPLVNSAPVRIGRRATDPAHAFSGTVDEVRLSAAARTAFHPVLGEADEGYRLRLRIFRRWVLPTRSGVQDALNGVVDTIAGVSDPFVVTDADSVLLQSTHVLSVLPVAVALGETLDDTGRRGLGEADVLGPPAQDEEFAAQLLVDGSDPRAEFVLPPAGSAPTVPGRPAADPRRMRVGSRKALRALLDALAADGVPGKLQVRAGFDPAAGDLRAVGRGLVLAHPGLPADRLAARALRAGFAFVAHRSGTAPARGEVHAAVRSTDSVDIIPGPGGTATPEHGFDATTGQSVGLRLEPPPPPGAAVRWSVIACGQGRAGFTGRIDQRDVVLRAERPGSLVVEVRVRDRGRSFATTRPLRIGPPELPAGQSIAASGRLGAGAPGALRTDERIHPVYLVEAPARFARPPGSEPRTRLVHPVLAARLAALAALLPPGDPELRSAWDPAAAGPAGAGREVSLGPGTSTASLARLGALAHAAGISHVANDGTKLTLSQNPGPATPVTGPAMVEEGSSATLSITRARPCALAFAAGLVWTVNGDTGSVSALDPGTGVVQACIRVGLAPVAAAAAPDGALLVVADAGDASLTVVTTATRQNAGRIPLTAPPADVAYRPDGTRAYAGLSSGHLVEVDPVARTVVRVLALGSPVVAVGCEPGGARLWAATADGRLRAVSLPAFTPAQSVNLAGIPGGLAVGTTRAYVTLPGASSLQVVDLAAAAVQGTFTDAGTAPGPLALAPAGDVLYVVDRPGGRVYLRRADGTAQVPPGPRPSLLLPGATAVTAVAGRAYVAQSGKVADTVAELDAAAGTPGASWPLGTGLGERLVWSVRLTGGARAELSGTTRPRTSVLGRRAGAVQVRAVLQWNDATAPYTMRVDLAEAVRAVESGGGRVVIRKDQYDLLMNVLNHLCPIGVEVDTRVVRAYVPELRAALLEAFPPYTYPDFRARGPRPPAWRFGLDP